jgi:hypothetical protein
MEAAQITVWGTKNMRFKIALAALAATAAFASPAGAQIVSYTETTDVRGTILQPLTLTEIDDLDFGTILASGVAGSVTIDEDTGNRTVVGGVAEVPLDPGHRAEFIGAGPAGGQVDLTLVPPAFLYNVANDPLTVTSMTLDGGVGLTDSRVIDGSGAFSVGVGGTFAIAAGQPNGVYTGTFDLTAEYQ